MFVSSTAARMVTSFRKQESNRSGLMFCSDCRAEQPINRWTRAAGACFVTRCSEGCFDSRRRVNSTVMSLKLLIRSATVEDAPAISALVTASTREHIASSLSDSGLSHLLCEMTTENQAKRIRSGYQFFVALESDTLVGTAAIRLPSHLYYLFVDTQHQRRGIGRQLWNHARDWIASSPNHGPITVNSSLNAITAYERLGFAIAGPPEENHGVRYQPMRWANAT